MANTYPEALEIRPLKRTPSLAVQVPGSKSMTNRVLVLAALTEGPDPCLLRGLLLSEDTEIMMRCLRSLGADLQLQETETEHASGISCLISPVSCLPTDADLHVGNSGTTMRFLTALVSAGRGRYRLDGVPRMRERPIEDLLDALRQLGVRAVSERQNGYPPVLIETEGLAGGRVRIRGDISSQFLSGLLMAAPLARRDVELELEGPLVSAPYVDMTVALMRRFGARVDTESIERFHVPAGQRYHARKYTIEPDASAASYFFAAAAITGGRVTVLDLPEQSLQGDVGFVDLLADMGCRVERCSSGITVHGRPLHGIDVDMNAISDCVMTLAAVACFAEGPTTIRNVAHIRHKETDRLSALTAELRRIGAGVGEFTDGLTITPAPLHGATIETYNDHRMAMSLALVGLRVPGIIIRNPACVAKTYPGFFDDLATLTG